MTTLDPKAESGPDLLERLRDDAAAWAAEFRKTAINLDYSDMDEGWLIGWFANAIENTEIVRQSRWQRSALSAVAPDVGEQADWQDDPSADDRWNAGLDFGMTQLCALLGVDPATVTWDAATETLDGDVQAVIGNILTAAYGDDWRELPEINAMLAEGQGDDDGPQEGR